MLVLIVELGVDSTMPNRPKKIIKALTVKINLNIRHLFLFFMFYCIFLVPYGGSVVPQRINLPLTYSSSQGSTDLGKGISLIIAPPSDTAM